MRNLYIRLLSKQQHFLPKQLLDYGNVIRAMGIFTLFLVGMNNAYAGPNWYLNITNATSHIIDVTDIDSAGNHCWDSDDLDNHNYILAHATKMFHTKENTLEKCFPIQLKYQSFLIDNHYASIASNYTSTLSSRYLSYAAGKFAALGVGQFNPLGGNIFLEFSYTGNNPNPYSVTFASWES